MKKCIKCGEVKSLEEFYDSKGKADGKNNKCKECIKAYQLERISKMSYEERIELNKKNVYNHKLKQFINKK